MLRRLWLVLVALLLFTVLTPAGASGGFDLWLYDRNTALLTRVDMVGTVSDTFTLPYVDTARETPAGVAVAPSGDRFAYAVTDATSLLTRLYVYERSTNTTVLAYDLGTDVFVSLNYAANSFVFSEDGGALVVAAATFDTAWRLLALGIDAPSTVEITSSSPGAAGVDAGAVVIPVPLYYRDGLASFYLSVVAGGGAFRNPSYTWDVAGGAIFSNPAFIGGYSSISPSGEVITALPDDRFGFTTTDAWPFGQANTLQVYRPSTGGLSPFYEASGLNLYQPVFVEGARRIFAPFVDTSNANFAMLLERDGTPIAALPSIRYYGAAGTLAGMVYLTPDNGAPADTVKLFALYTSDGVTDGETGDLLWTAPSTSSFPQIVWTSDVLVSSADPAAEWARLADPVCGDMGCAMGSAGSVPELGEPPSIASAELEVMVYQEDSGVVTHLARDGSVIDSFTLSLGRGDRWSPTVAVSTLGDLFAYTVAGSGTDRSILMLYSRPLDSVLYGYTFDEFSAYPGSEFYTSLDFDVDRFAFNEDGSQFAIGAGIASDNFWSVTVHDVATGAVTMLRSSDAAASGVSGGSVPVVKYFRRNQVFFYMLFLGDGAARYQAYRWDLMTNSVVPTNLYSTYNTDTFAPTEELLMPYGDPSLPLSSNPDAFPFGQTNAIAVYDPELEDLTTLYHDAETSFSDARFVQNGERVLARTYAADSTRYDLLLMRDGTLIADLPLAAEPGDLRGTNDGLVYLAANSTLDTTELFYFETRAGFDAASPGVVLWSTSGTYNSRIAWVNQSSGSMPPGSGPMGSVTGGAGTPVLSVGGEAIINTTEGDQLNIRSGPGTSFSVITRANNGTRVSILEGPSSSGGLTWWRVRLPDGTEGWAVEVADGVQALVPVSGGGGTTGGSSTALRVGGRAEVVTDALNVRSSPSRSASVAEILARGAVVEVIEGPRSADGLTWWRIRSASGMDGWAVESFDGNPALAGR
jgi:SH3-like domain-containing protein